MIVIILLLLWVIMFGGLSIIQNIFNTNAARDLGDRDLNLPPSDDDCSQYDIYDEFVSEFGITAVTNARIICEAANGYWIEEDDEIGCLFPPRPVDCNADFIDDSEDFCEDDLEATYLCDASIGYLGCFCNMLPPDPCEEICDGYDHSEFLENGAKCIWGTQIDYCCCWNEEGEDPDGQSACELSYPYCDANCDEDQWCMEIVPYTLMFQQPWCDCVDLYYDSDCDEFCQDDYGYDYGDLAHSHYDCDDNEDYIDGCCCGYNQNGQGYECDYGFEAGYESYCTQFPCSEGVCSSYWDYDAQGWACLCTEDYFCDICIDYYFTDNCECPPGSHVEMKNRSYRWCVPDDGDCGGI